MKLDDLRTSTLSTTWEMNHLINPWLRGILCCTIIAGVWATQGVLAADDTQWQKDRYSGAEASWGARYSLVQRRRYPEAEKFLSAAVKDAEAFGPQDLRLATSLKELAEFYQAEERYAEAEQLYKRSLAIRQKVIGPNTTDVAWILDGLASLYSKQGKYAEAEPLYKRSLAIKEKAFGPNQYNSHVASSLRNLADLYYRQGRYAEAEPLYKGDPTIKQKWFGPNDSYVEGNLYPLADIYYREGKYAEAELFYKRLLAKMENTPPPGDNTYLAAVLKDMAKVYLAQGKYAEAEPMFKRSFAMTEKLLGSNYLEVESLEDYASLLRKTNRAKEAEELEARAKEIKAKAELIRK